jgi:glycosyltransferase involved in cell wall biosynthesis
MRLCAVIPTYRHVIVLPGLVEALRRHCEMVFVIDDGNETPARAAIAALHHPDNGVTVIRLDVNSGKGAAVLAGLRTALAQGFTHALQIDADGQHDLADLQKFVDAARAAPNALICGAATYDGSVPRSRKFGRYITHFLVWVETFSFDIADSMCGYRLYPLKAAAPVIEKGSAGSHMDFDTEIAVRLHWRGVAVVNIPTRVIYPPNNVSNFHMLADNVRMTWLHTRLLAQAPFRVLWKIVARPTRGRG